MNSKPKYPSITVGYGTPEQREIGVDDYVQAQFKDGRLITVMKLEDNSFMSVVENPEKSGRHPRQEIWLSEESFAGLMSVCWLLGAHSDFDMDAAVRLASEDKDIHYVFSEKAPSHDPNQ